MAEQPAINRLANLLPKCRRSKGLAYGRLAVSYCHVKYFSSPAGSAPERVQGEGGMAEQPAINRLAQPAINRLAHLLQKCRKSKDLAYARRLHDYVCQHELHLHPVLGNYLVPMLVDCGSLPEAQQAFDQLPHRNTHSWNCLILGHIDSGEFEHGFRLYQAMCDEDSIQPNSYTFGALLKACARLTDMEKGREVRLEIVRWGFEKDPFVGNALVDMFAKCGCLAEAQDVFNELPHRNVVSWTALMVGYMEDRRCEDALSCFKRMQLDGVAPDLVTFICSLKACGSLGAIDSGREVHADLIRSGLEDEVSIGNTLVDMYGKCGWLADAYHVFGKLPVQGTVSWNTLIARYGAHGRNEEAINSYKKMQVRGVASDSVTLLSVLKACGHAGAIESSMEIHSEVVMKGLETDLSISNTLVDIYGKHAGLAEVQSIFDNLPVRDSVSWNALIAAYAEHGHGNEALFCFEQMQSQGIFPDVVTFICSLKACGSIRAIEMGRKLCSMLAKEGFGTDLHVGCILVDMYVKCGSLAEAQEAFDNLPVRDAVSWTSLISGYDEQGLSEEALNCFEQMQMEGIFPDDVTFVCGLKACGTVAAVEKGQQLCVEIVKRGLERDIFIGSTLVDMYAKCGFFAEAQKSLNQLPGQNAVARTALISGLAENGFGDEALSCLQQMQQEGVAPDASTYVCTLKACGSTGYLERGRQLRAEIAKKGLESDRLVGNALIDMFVQCGAFGEAHQVFNKLAGCDVVSWNTLISGYTEHGLGMEALSLFEEMQAAGVFPDNVTFVCSLKACGSIQAIERGREIHSLIVQLGLENDTSISNTLIDMFSKCGFLIEAQKVFSKMSVRDRVSWNALIAGYAEHGFSIEALSSFDRMQESMCPDAVTFVCSLKACGSMKALEKGQDIHSEIAGKGLIKEFCVGNTLVDMYAKCASLAEAQEVFDKLPVRDSVSWAALISGYAENGFDRKVLNCFEKMQLEGISGDSATLVHCLKACANIGALETGRGIHGHIRIIGLEGDCFVGNALVDMYGKCGSPREGQEVFDKLPVQDVVSWNALIKAYGENHEGELAVQCFDEMQERGVKPDSITFTCLLVACSHASLVSKGQDYFKLMLEKHSIEPSWDHYLCMVDLFARSGHIHKAHGFSKEMQCPPSKEILTALLSACKNYGKLELGERCFLHLVNVNQGDAAAHLLMADMYSSIGMWSDASRIEELRKHVGAQKKPASASIEIDKMSHEFVVGSKQNEDLSAMSEKLAIYMKSKGYVPNLDLLMRCISDSEKEMGIL